MNMRVRYEKYMQIFYLKNLMEKYHMRGLGIMENNGRITLSRVRVTIDGVCIGNWIY
jgi:hypothetical protein